MGDRFIPGTVDTLLAKAQALVDALADEEANHGGLISRETLNAAGRLRLELSVWQKSPQKYNYNSAAVTTPEPSVSGGNMQKMHGVVTTIETAIPVSEGITSTPNVSGQNSPKTPSESITPDPAREGLIHHGGFTPSGTLQTRGNTAVSPGDSTAAKSTLRGERGDA